MIDKFRLTHIRSDVIFIQSQNSIRPCDDTLGNGRMEMFNDSFDCQKVLTWLTHSAQANKAINE